MLTPGQRANSTSEVFVAQVDAHKEELAGKLFVLIEIESRKINDLKIVNFLIDTISHNYYQNEKMILKERVSTIKVEHIFESALVNTNKKLTEFLAQEKIKLNPELINATIGIIYQDNIHFTTLGKNKALLIYKNKAAQDKIKYKIADITAKSSDKERKKQINPVKLFTNIVSGSIPEENFFIFTNESLPEYLSHKQLIDIITKLPPASALEQIKNTLVNINAYVSFLAILIKNSLSDKPAKESIKQIKHISSQSSVESLNVTEEVTEKLLTPSGIINVKSWLSWEKIKTKIFSLTNLTRLKPIKNEKKILLKDKIFFGKKTFRQKFLEIYHLLKDASFYLINILVFIFRTITDVNKSAALLHAFKNKVVTKLNRLKNLFKNLGKIQKFSLVIIIISLFLFIVNLTVVSFKNKKVQDTQAYDILVKQIEQKLNQADASLLYSNEDRAGELLKEINQLLTQLPKENEEQQEKFAQFSAKVNEQKERVRKVIRIESPTELANFINLNSHARPGEIILAPNVGKIYTSDSNQVTIYSLDITNNLITAITDIKQPITSLSYPVIDKDNNIYYFNNNSIVKLDTNKEELTNLTINLTSGTLGIVSMATYNNRLYLLDKINNQIYRYNKSANGFPDYITWIEEKIDLSQAVDLSIDGHIYVLSGNGQLLKLLKGQEVEFKLDAIDPAFEEPTKLKVSDEQKYIYILEPKNKRLVVFDKTGEFLAQYYSDQFNDLKDFTVDETNKEIYFLNSTSVYVIEGEHFEE